MADYFANLQLRSPEDIVREEAARQGVDPDLAAAVARQESGFRQNAVSPKGAVGVMQLMPATAASLGVNPAIESENIRGGVKYLRQMSDRYGDTSKALAAYNAGPGRVDSGRELPQETQNYIAAINPQPDSTRPSVDFTPDLFSQPAAPETVTPQVSTRRNPLQKNDRPGFLTRSLLESTTGESAEQRYEKLLPTLQKLLPQSMQGTYLTDLAGEVAKAGPQAVDFLTSPVGLGLVAAHLFPATAPFAAATDVVLGGKQAFEAIPDVVSAATDLRDPHKVGRAIVDILGAYAGLKGGARVGQALREMPADLSRGAPMVKAYADAFRRTAPPPAAPTGVDLRRTLQAAEPEDRGAIVAQAEQPTSLRAKAEQQLYRTPYVRGAVNLLAPGVKKPPLLDMAQTMVDERAANIEANRNNMERELRWIRENVPEEEQNVRKLGYAMEGDIPASALSPQGQEALGKLRALNRERDQMLRDTYGDSVNLQDPETYIRHYWDFSDGGNQQLRFGAASRMMRDPSLRARQIGSLKQGIEVEGLTPQYENVTDIVRRRHMEAVQAAENQKFANTLRDFGLIVDPTKANIGTHRGWGAAEEAPALMRAVYSGKSDGAAVMRPKAPLVHPDIQMAVNAVFNEPWRGWTWSAINQMRAFTKQIKVGYSLFHNNALSEISQAHAISAGGPQAIGRFAKAVAWPLDPEFTRAIRSSTAELRGQTPSEAPPQIRWPREVVEPWIRANLSLQSGESESAAIRAAQQFLANKGPILKAIGAPVRALGNIQYVFNRGLFDYYLPGQMIHAADHLYANELNRLGPTATPEQTFALRREIADHVNRTFGADNMQRLLLTPKAQQALGVVLFAPMWTLSNLRALTKGFETTTGARLTGRYIGGAALTYFLTSQLANYAISDWYAKHSDDPNAGAYWDPAAQKMVRGGHWTWQNPGNPVQFGEKYVPGLSDNAANIYFGQNPDGSQRYIRLGKGFREPFNWLADPVGTLGNKLSMPLRQVLVQVTGHEPSGYPVINEKLTPEQQREQRVASVLNLAVPFSANALAERLERWYDPSVFRETGTASQLYGLPARKGASFYGSVEALREALSSGRKDMAEQVLRNAALNKINPGSVIRELRSRLRSQARTEVGLPKTQPPPADVGEPQSVDFSNMPLREPEE